MATTFVTISRDHRPDEPGFWMRDEMLELWLRLLSLHLPEPTANDDYSVTVGIRNQWLLASKAHFGGCVPHGIREAWSTRAGQAVVRHAIGSLMTALGAAEAPLSAHTLNLLGFEHPFGADVPIGLLRDIGYAFEDLLDGKLTIDASSTEVMPGSKPYRRR